MNLQSVQDFLQSRTSINTNDVETLEQFVEQYPWFSIGLQLLLKGYKDTSNPAYNELAKIVPLYALSRRRLFFFIGESANDTDRVIESIPATQQARRESEVENDERPISFNNEFFMEKHLVLCKKPSVALPNEYNLIESNTDYAKRLSTQHANFDSIRKISTEMAEGRHDTGRGVKILESVTELLDYMYSFGNMHKAKLVSALEVLPKSFSTELNIIDWGCGQGIGSMIFLERFKSATIKGITLIEPSEIALKRAALHVKQYNKNISPRTICSKLDDLHSSQFVNDSSGRTTIHLFSNILDIDDYKQSHLIELIKATQSGTNYFVCVSPYIDEIKTERLESFKRYFQTNYSTFELLLDKCNSMRTNDFWNCNNTYKNNSVNHGGDNYCGDNYTENGCKRKWTRVVKVFKVIL